MDIRTCRAQDNQRHAVPERSGTDTTLVYYTIVMKIFILEML